MSLMSFLLLLCVAAAIIYGVRSALAGQWKELVVMVVVVFCILWVFSALGVTLPSLPTGR